jgi:S-adenosylmethionine uptake transporter
MKGIGLASLGYACFSVQDTTVKWLVADYSVAQVLFTRSLVIMLVAVLIGGPRAFHAVAVSPNKRALVTRAALILVAWLSYYTAARHLGLAQLTTLYFAAPIGVVLLSIFILKETVHLGRWIAVVAGFAGVLIAADPGGAVDLMPAALALFAAFCWALSVILVRVIARSESTASQMLVSNGLFAVTCAVILLWSWRTPDLFSLGLMVGLGIAGGAGQYFVYEGFRYAPASALAPIEYTGLVWAFFYGYVIWAEVPALHVFIGAALIVAGSIAFILVERDRARRLATPVRPASGPRPPEER